MEVVVIKVDIGIFPQSYVSDEPESGGFFPFAIDGETSYLYDISFVERKDEKEVEDFVSKWMRVINRFPLYIFFECFDFHQKEIEEECKSKSIEFTESKRRENGFYIKVKVRNIEQFNVIFPYLYANGSMNNFACLSLEEDVFTIGNRNFKNFWGENEKIETPIITLNGNSIVFWVNYDGDSMVIISNDKKYSELSLVINTLPEETDYSVIEYGE
ncbi:hypothetical protein [Halalkalibacter urbisdiaboli]|uniref:hypothetical protein n=1 Tax=Halalkalibacter urbisdiaboli TaxID=1960589 RepID=UPI000B438574|nr:hypothetical protein [Halalkalibacter urbisdiaboli]